jgi:hypothetical protein
LGAFTQHVFHPPKRRSHRIGSTRAGGARHAQEAADPDNDARVAWGLLDLVGDLHDPVGVGGESAPKEQRAGAGTRRRGRPRFQLQLPAQALATRLRLRSDTTWPARACTARLIGSVRPWTANPDSISSSAQRSARSRCIAPTSTSRTSATATPKTT